MDFMDTNRAILIQVNGTTRGKMPYIRNESRSSLTDRAREAVGLSREYPSIITPEKAINFIIDP